MEKTIARRRARTLWVIALTAAMMGLEILFGTLTGSMALLADGWHMATHVGALTITYLAYRLTRSERLSAELCFGPGKVIPIGGYTSAIGLALAAVWMGVESIERLRHPVGIQYGEAIVVSFIGLVVNIVSAFILGQGDDFHADEIEHGHAHADHNLKSAYFHVLADALTSVLALVALGLGKYFAIPQADAIVGVLGAAIILRWSYGLLRETAWELLDRNLGARFEGRIRETVVAAGGTVVDLKVWRTGMDGFACFVRVRADPAIDRQKLRPSLEAHGWKHLSIDFL